MTTTPTPSPFNAPDPTKMNVPAEISPKMEGGLEFEDFLNDYFTPDLKKTYEAEIDQLRDVFFDEFLVKVIEPGAESAVEAFETEVVAPKQGALMEQFIGDADARAKSMKGHLPVTAKEIEVRRFQGRYEDEDAPDRVVLIKALLEPAFDSKAAEIKAEGADHAKKIIDAKTTKVDTETDPEYAKAVKDTSKATVDSIIKGDQDNEGLRQKLDQLVAEKRGRKARNLGKTATHGKAGSKEEADDPILTMLSEAEKLIKARVPELRDGLRTELAQWLKDNRGNVVDEAGAAADLKALAGDFERILADRFFDPNNMEEIAANIRGYMLTNHKHLMEKKAAPTAAAVSPEQQAGLDIIELQALVDPSKLGDLMQHIGTYLGAKGNPSVLSAAKAAANAVTDPNIRYQIITGLLVPPSNP